MPGACLTGHSHALAQRGIGEQPLERLRCRIDVDADKLARRATEMIVIHALDRMGRREIAPMAGLGGEGWNPEPLDSVPDCVAIAVPVGHNGGNPSRHGFNRSDAERFLQIVGQGGKDIRRAPSEMSLRGIAPIEHNPA